MLIDKITFQVIISLNEPELGSRTRKFAILRNSDPKQSRN